MTRIDPDAPKALWFSEARIEQGHIALRCARPLPDSFALHALVGGIRIGSYDSAGAPPLAPGDILEVPCGYYPNKGLPTEIRFALGGSDEDAAPPIALTALGQVIRLVGYDPLDEATLSVADGKLVGTALNRSNAHRKFQPPLLARVNGHEIREVSLDAVTPYPGGGAWLSFSAPIQPTDFHASGAEYEILALPGFTPVARTSFHPAPGGAGLESRLVRTEAALAQLERRLTREMDRTETAADQRHRAQRRMIDGFAEYMLSVIYDRMAAGDPAQPGSAEEEAAIAAFRQMISDAGDGAPPKTAPAAMVDVALQNVAAHRGWYKVELRGKGASILWMGATGTFENPHPDTPIEMISVEVQSVVSPDVLPLSALFDGAPAEIEVRPGFDTLPFRVTFRPQGGPRPVHKVQLVPDRALSPKDVGTSQDARKLSVAISAVSLHFDRGAGT